VLYKKLKIKMQIRLKTSQVYLLSGLCPSPTIQISQLFQQLNYLRPAWDETYPESDTERLSQSMRKLPRGFEKKKT